MKSPAFVWFLRMWAVAILAHIVANPPTMRGAPVGTGLGTVTALLGVFALAVIIKPDRRYVVIMGCLTVASAVLEAPFIGNHWVVAGLVSIGLVVSTFTADPWSTFRPVGMGVLLAFYSFAAFAKFNRGFFDPDVSCGVTYANQLLGSYGLRTIPIGGGLAVGVAVATAVIELSVPILLIMRRTRHWGVVLGFLFHLFISIDLGQHFYDFSSLLVALFSLFLAESMIERFGEPVVRARWIVVPALAWTTVLVALAVLPVGRNTARFLGGGPFWVWIPWAVFLCVRCIRMASAGGPVSERLPRLGALAWVLVAVTVFNGLTPYLELKTGYGFNMYANLVTVDGKSNHLLIRRTLPLTDVQDDPYVVEETDDLGLGLYVGSGLALTEDQLFDYLAAYPETTATVRRVESGERLVVDGDDGVALSWWRDKFQLFRAIDLGDPPRCQLSWLPAR